MSLRYGDFAMTWQPVPEGIPLRTALAYLSGALLLAGGIAMLLPKMATRASGVMAIFLLSWLVLLQAPRVVKSPLDAGVWLGVGETLVLVTGGWVYYLLAKQRAGKSSLGRSDDPRRWLRLARVFYAMALPLIGLAHFVYADATASMVPAWLPERKAFAYLTGAGHIAAGFGLLIGCWPRLAATMEAAMVACFVLLLHLPGVLAAPTDRLQWTMLCVAVALDGACWAVAASLAGEAWTRVPWRATRGATARSTAA